MRSRGRFCLEFHNLYLFLKIHDESQLVTLCVTLRADFQRFVVGK